MTQVLIVDDSKITREALSDRLRETGEFNIVAAIANAANAEIVCMRGNIDLILMDVCTADNESGLQAAAKIKKHSPQVKIIIMTSMPEHSFIQKAKASGCDSFWYKDDSTTDLTDVCRRTVCGESIYPAATPPLSIGCTDSRELTDRELEVIRALTLGCKYDEISDMLGISTNTVKYHIKNLLQKTGYRNATQLVAEVVEKRLILPKY